MFDAQGPIAFHDFSSAARVVEREKRIKWKSHATLKMRVIGLSDYISKSRVMTGVSTVKTLVALSNMLRSKLYDYTYS